MSASMAAQSPSSRPEPQIQHSFDGDVKVLNGTYDRRAEIRNALKAFHLDVQRLEGAPLQIQANISIRVGGTQAKEHTYTVTLSSPDFDAPLFFSQVPSAQPDSGRAAGSTLRSTAVNGQQATPRSESQKSADDDNVVEIRPFKRQRTGETSFSGALPQHPLPSAKDLSQLSDFMREWHTEWVRQGGWLYDNITTMSAMTANNRTGLEQKLDVVQDVLGQSINSASATTMAELANISKLLPWLENCRKTSSDQVQAREEKWRTSSATFHDQSRRDREAAEKRIERKLEEQKDLLLRVIRAKGLQADEVEAVEGGSAVASREESLGARLAAELNMEASRARPVSKYDASTGSITIEMDT